jgi:hypothetical protein
MSGPTTSSRAGPMKHESSVCSTLSTSSAGNACRSALPAGSNSTDVIDVLSDLFIPRGIPGHIRSDNGPEFIAKAVCEWIVAVGAKTAFIEPGSPWENGYCESFNSKLRDELLNGEIFYSLAKARVVIESWRRYYNGRRLRPTRHDPHHAKAACRKHLVMNPKFPDGLLRSGPEPSLLRKYTPGYFRGAVHLS